MKLNELKTPISNLKQRKKELEEELVLVKEKLQVEVLKVKNLGLEFP